MSLALEPLFPQNGLAYMVICLSNQQQEKHQILNVWLKVQVNIKEFQENILMNDAIRTTRTTAAKQRYFRQGLATCLIGVSKPHEKQKLEKKNWKHKNKNKLSAAIVLENRNPCWITIKCVKTNWV